MTLCTVVIQSSQKSQHHASMSVSLIPSLEILPVEILHHILDDLDAQTILFSFRNTCRQFRAVVNSYDRYVLDFQSISKPAFDFVCHLIDPWRVTSLTLSENDKTFDQIKLFLSHFNLRQFSRLRSLSLFITEEEQLKTIVERFSIRSLESFSLKIEKSDDRRKTTTARLLSSIIAKMNLTKLELYIQEGRFEKIRWPTQCSIRYLRIDNIISFDQICDILRSSPHLRTLITNSIFILNPKPSVSTSFQHLTSLTLSKVNKKIDDLEVFLLLTPSLVHLKLIGYGNYFDGNRWEHFIQLHLLLLNKFEFFFNELRESQQNLPDIEQIMASFQTPFWLEQKKWFVVCEVDKNTARCISLYSIPICVPCLSYETGKTSMSTFHKINDKNISIMDNVDTVKLDFTKLIPLDIEKKENTINYPLFRKVKKLELHFDTARSHGWVEFVSNLIDLKTIIQVKVSSTLIRQSNPYMLANMTKLLQQTSHVSSVDICFGFLSRKSWLNASEICSMIPSHVKHLAVSIKDLNEIQCIFERLENLSSANFFFDYIPSWNQITTWLDSNRKDSSYQADSFSVCVWLGKINNRSKEIKVGNKRIKLADEHHQ